jgi:hypothetical protein
MFKVKLLGSDPEFILRDKQTNSPVSAIGLYEHRDAVKLYADNVLAEASHTPFPMSEFTDGIRSVLSTVSSIASDFKSGCTFTVGECEAFYSDEQLSAPEAHAIGCNPFQNAYDLGVNRVPIPYTNNARYAGGHIHIAYKQSTLPPHLLIQLLDDTLLPHDPNHGKTPRSDFYGAKGSFRHKPYGVEYRSISNWWMSNPDIVVSAIKDIENYVNRKYYGI